MKKTILSCLLSIALTIQTGLCPVYAETEEKEQDLNLYAQSAVLIDAESGRILYGKEETLQRPMASTTKIMTCILALENGKMDDKVQVSSYAASQPKVHLGATAKETFYMKDLLYSLMLESHNDTAVMIAEHIGGDVKGFADMMNQKARDLGCKDTFFITPNGLDAVEKDGFGKERIHSTTAADLARIMAYCVLESPKKEEFLEITRTQNYYFSDIEGKRSFSCVNHNAFLTMMSGVMSGKTGFTGGAGYSYIAALEDGDRKFVAALLGCGWPPHKTYKWSDAKQLFNYGLDHYQYRDVYEEQTLKPIAVTDGIGADGDLSQTAFTGLSLNLREEDRSLKLLMRDGEEVQVTYEIAEVLEAPVRAGMSVGNVSYYLEGEKVKVYPVYTTDTVEKITFKWCLEQVVSAFLSLEGMV